MATNFRTKIAITGFVWMIATRNWLWRGFGSLSGRPSADIASTLHLRDVAMATNFGSRIAITGFVLAIATRLLVMEGALSGRPTKYTYCRYTATQGRCHGNHFFGFLYMGCTLAPPGEYDWAIGVWRRCGLMSNYFDHLLVLIFTLPVVLIFNHDRKFHCSICYN